jgi:hypothetical protein
MKLTIELVPFTAWNQSLYNLLPRNEWYSIKNKVFAQEGHRCYICGNSAGTLSLHEFWNYDENTHVQKLIEFHHLCNLCHKIKHIGFWCHTWDGQVKLRQEGYSRDDLIKHFCKVNGCSTKEFEQHEKEAFRMWNERSQHDWTQDFGEYGKFIQK